MNEKYINELQVLYKAGNLIPVIGAGCSIPLSAPSWYELVNDILITNVDKELHKGVKFFLDKHDYWKAISLIIDYAPMSESDIQQDVADKVLRIELDRSIDNNLKDLANMDFNIYLTLNYDHFLEKFMDTSTIPICLREVDFNTQDFFKLDGPKRCLHLHGHATNAGTIVLTKNSYDSLYSDDKYKNLFSLLSASKTCLFLGLSMDDQFMLEMIKDNVEMFRNSAYVLMDISQRSKYELLKSQYNINVIEYDSSKSTHVEEIRKILKKVGGKEIIEVTDVVISEKVGVVFDEERVESAEYSLFCKKLKLEELPEELIHLSKLYFFAAEEYIGALRMNMVSKDLISKVMFKIYIAYQEQFVKEYRKNRSSEAFVSKVHEVLSELDLSRYLADALGKQDILADEKAGLIHILADDANRNVWWGEKRIEEGVKGGE